MNICIFCGSSAGVNPVYAETAVAMGELLAERGHTLVYGGGRTGLMGLVADSCLKAGGTVFGVMPRALVQKEIQHTGLTRLEIVDSMHERKLKMADLSDGFIALPGGMGTLEEIFEQWTWLMLGIHRKPCAFLNVNFYYDDLKNMIARVVTDGFMQAHHADTVLFDDRGDVILDHFTSYNPPPIKWQEPAKPR